MKSKIFIILNIIFVLGCIAGDIALGFYFNFNSSFFYSTIFFVLGIAIGNLIFLIIHLLIETTYKFNKFIPIMHASYLVISALMYYVIEWVGKFDEYKIIYWSVYGGLVAVDLIVFLILSFRKEPDDKPKFKVNQR